MNDLPDARIPAERDRTPAAEREHALVPVTTRSPSARTAAGARGDEEQLATGRAGTPRRADGGRWELPEERAVVAQAAHENFPVASRILPRSVRDDLMAIYGFARLTDDIGDEVAGDRSGALDWLEDEVRRAAAGSATHPILRRVGATIRSRGLDLQPFVDLVDANRMDQEVRRYETFDDLLGYCRLSANPVGRLVLGVLGLATTERIARSDDVCSGLQVVEHLQDVAEDAAMDRVYLPLADLRAERCGLDALREPSAAPALRRVIRREADRARHLLWSGAPLAASLPWRPRVAVAGFAAGGMAALDDIERAGFDVLATECRPQPRRLAARLLLVLLWHPAAPAPTGGGAGTGSTTGAPAGAAARRSPGGPAHAHDGTGRR